MSSDILLIVNDQNALRTLVHVIHSMGHSVKIAHRAIEGLDLARQMSPNLIISDLNLGNMTGRELAITLRADQRFSQIPIIVIVPAKNTRERELCLAAGIYGFIDDPINEHTLPLQIDFFLSGGRDIIEDKGRMDKARDQYLQDVVQRLESRIRELEDKNDELQRLDDMKDSFIQLTAHELRTPLTLITGYSRLIEDHPLLRRLMENDLEIAPLIEGLSDSINRMQVVIEEILTVSRIMTSKIELNITNADLGAIVERVVHGFDEAFRERHLELVYNIDQFPSTIRGDEGLLQQMLANLISNAIKYTPDGGMVVIESITDNQTVRFSVRDTGIGIDPTMHEKIFERLHIGGDIALHSTSKTTFRGGGLGLGLAICRGIVEAHGGKIWVESEGYNPETLPGSAFIVTMPIVATASTRPLARLKRLPLREN